MKTPASIKGHPIHPMVVALPIGLWIFSLVADIINFTQWGSEAWRIVALYTLGGGVVTALIAAVPGFIDLLSFQELKLKRMGLAHMTVNLLAVTIFAIDWWLRYRRATDARTTFLLSLVGVIFILVSGWIGGTLVHRYRVSVEEGNISDMKEPAKPTQ
jgi:uncharacterized membrane protein